MNYRIALHGGLFSGKSTLAAALEAQGFGYINYTQLLKMLTVGALNAIGIDATLEDLEGRDKERYRPYVISTGSVRGFDQGWGIDEVVVPLLAKTGEPQGVVFDNVRFDAQMDKLVPLGFRLVRLTTPWAVRMDRAERKGMTVTEFRTATQDGTERPLSYYPGEIEVSVDGPMDAVLQELSDKIAEAVLAERRTVA